MFQVRFFWMQTFDARPQWICQARVGSQGFFLQYFGGVFLGVILFLEKGPRLT